MNRLIKKAEKKLVQSILRGIARWAIKEFFSSPPLRPSSSCMILYGKDKKPISIKCLTCGMTSHNENDIKYKYCGNCHRYHSQ